MKNLLSGSSMLRACLRDVREWVGQLVRAILPSTDFNQPRLPPPLSPGQPCGYADLQAEP